MNSAAHPFAYDLDAQRCRNRQFCGRLSWRDRWFESGSLQRRVRRTPTRLGPNLRPRSRATTSTGRFAPPAIRTTDIADRRNQTPWPALTRFSAAEILNEKRAPNEKANHANQRDRAACLDRGGRLRSMEYHLPRDIDRRLYRNPYSSSPTAAMLALRVRPLWRVLAAHGGNDRAACDGRVER